MSSSGSSMKHRSRTRHARASKERPTLTSSAPNDALVRIRRARLSDDAALLRMMKPFNRHELIAWRPARTRVALRRLLGDARLGAVFVAEAPGRALVGYVVATFGYDLEFAGPDAFVTELFVQPTARRGGLGKRLLEAVIGFLQARATGAVHLVVRPGNRAARSLYAQLGFEDVPRLIMTKPLARPTARRRAVKKTT